MRSVATALCLGDPHVLVPDVGARVRVQPREGVLLHFDGTSYVMRLPIHPRDAAALAGLGRVLLAVGLDPLGTSAAREAVDDYMQEALSAGRIFFGSASVVPPAGEGFPERKR